MCGRYEFSTELDNVEIDDIIREIANGTYDEFATGEIFPTNNAPVLLPQNGKTSAAIMQWGFPKWDGKGVIINARSETASEKKTFAKPLQNNRCIIPSTGFYEWNKSTKQKFLFNLEDARVLYMAGIYNSYIHEGIPVYNFVILTRSANKYINDIHERMPVVLRKNELGDWLNNDSAVAQLFNRDDIALTRAAL